MSKLARNILIFVIILFFLVAFSPSYVSLDIDNLVYVAAIGIDKGSREKFNISFQFTPGGAHSENGTTSKAPLVINSVEASSIDSAVNLMNAYMAKELNLSHCRLIVFSEVVSYDGISNEIYTLINDPQVRPSTNVIVSKNTAKGYLENSESPLENLITKHYQIFPNSSKYTGYVYDASLSDFYNQMLSPTAEPIAILGGINTNSKEDAKQNSSDVSDIKSTNTSFVGENNTENFGVAVFRDDKLVGELTALETLCLSILQKQVNSFFVQIPDLNDTDKKIDLMFYPKDDCKIDVSLIHGNPYITIDANFTARIYSMNENSKYLDNQVLKDLSQKANNYLKDVFTRIFV